ncbi:hypothetical protein BHE74_00024728 [Ensete ventricosum]|nr:hypothetical protein BHE74_00024728 [Ensete ventricosum]RZR83984.1 hypothetical protein BHM03_00010717 [Ensete ventricosum]
MTVGKHKSHCGEGSSRAPSRDKKSTVSSEEPAPRIYRRPKSMKDLCRIAICKNDEGYNVLHMVDLSPKDPDSEMQADGQT